MATGWNKKNLQKKGLQFAVFNCNLLILGLVRRSTKRLLGKHFRLHPFGQSVIIFLFVM